MEKLAVPRAHKAKQADTWHGEPSLTTIGTAGLRGSEYTDPKSEVLRSPQQMLFAHRLERPREVQSSRVRT